MQLLGEYKIFGMQSLPYSFCSGVEPELFPALRKYGLSFYAYSPLAGGFFTTPFRSPDAEVEAGSRFDPTKIVGKVRNLRGVLGAFIPCALLLIPLC